METDATPRPDSPIPVAWARGLFKKWISSYCNVHSIGIKHESLSSECATDRMEMQCQKIVNLMYPTASFYAKIGTSNLLTNCDEKLIYFPVKLNKMIKSKRFTIFSTPRTVSVHHNCMRNSIYHFMH